jgi:hypothetical protein
LRRGPGAPRPSAPRRTGPARSGRSAADAYASGRRSGDAPSPAPGAGRRRRRGPGQAPVVGRRRPAPHLDPGLAAPGRQQAAVQRIVLVAGLRPPVPPLGHMVRRAGDDEAGRGRGAPGSGGESIECTVTVILPNF